MVRRNRTCPDRRPPTQLLLWTVFNSEAISMSGFFSFFLKISFCLFVIVQLLSRVQLFVIPWTGRHQPSLSFTVSWSLFKLMSIELMMPSNHLILCHPLLLLPSIFPSIRVFSNESALRIRWPKYWSFSFAICPSKGHSGFISFKTVWFDHLTVQGTSCFPRVFSCLLMLCSFIFRSLILVVL